MLCQSHIVQEILACQVAFPAGGLVAGHSAVKQLLHLGRIGKPQGKLPLEVAAAHNGLCQLLGLSGVDQLTDGGIHISGKTLPLMVRLRHPFGIQQLRNGVARNDVFCLPEHGQVRILHLLPPALILEDRCISYGAGVVVIGGLVTGHKGLHLNAGVDRVAGVCAKALKEPVIGCGAACAIGHPIGVFRLSLGPLCLCTLLPLCLRPGRLLRPDCLLVHRYLVLQRAHFGVAGIVSPGRVCPILNVCQMPHGLRFVMLVVIANLAQLLLRKFQHVRRKGHPIPLIAAVPSLIGPLSELSIQVGLGIRPQLLKAHGNGVDLLLGGILVKAEPAQGGKGLPHILKFPGGTMLSAPSGAAFRQGLYPGLKILADHLSGHVVVRTEDMVGAGAANLEDNRPILLLEHPEILGSVCRDLPACIQCEGL